MMLMNKILRTSVGADLSASRGRSAIQINELNDKKNLLIRKQ
jgi:hypothetical protein